MTPNDVFALCVTAGEGGTPPKPDNDNWGVASKWQTPAEALQKIRRMKDEMRRELRADFRLRSCPTHRLHWDMLIEAEKCALWQFYGIRSDDQ
jgi:hypothetical protein